MFENLKRKLIERRIKRLIWQNERYLKWSEKVKGYYASNIKRIIEYEQMITQTHLNTKSHLNRGKQSETKSTEEKSDSEKDFFEELEKGVN